MRKTETKGLGRLVYAEWLIPFLDYYKSLKKNEAVFEIFSPLVVSIFATLVYWKHMKISVALDGLADLLPSVISILIGFTVMFITLLLTSDTDAITRLKKASTDNKVRGKAISLYQKLHIQLTRSLIAEIGLLLLIFGYLFWKGIGMSIFVESVLLTFEVYLTLHILLVIIRSMTNLYCVFYGKSTGI